MLEKNASEKGMLEIYMQSVDRIEKTMSRPVGSTMVDFNFGDVASGKKLDYTIGQVFQVQRV